jgi:hypothetical protein
MVKKSSKKQVVGWTGSSLAKGDLTKMREEGFLAKSTDVCFPSAEIIPAPPEGYWVMFLAFFLRGFSFPAHEFLGGLLFVYGVQLH